MGKLGWSTTLFVEGNYLEGNEEVSADNVLLGEKYEELKSAYDALDTEKNALTRFTGDIVNYNQENLKLVLSSYEGGRLIDVNVQEVPVQTYVENVTASVSSGDEIKAFLWREDMEPVMAAEMLY